MEKVELTRRKVLQTAVAALCVEAGYLSVESQALGALTEATQSCESLDFMVASVRHTRICVFPPCSYPVSTCT